MAEIGATKRTMEKMKASHMLEAFQEPSGQLASR